MNKKFVKACCTVLAGVLIAGSFSACQGNKDMVSPDPDYTKSSQNMKYGKTRPKRLFLSIRFIIWCILILTNVKFSIQTPFQKTRKQEKFCSWGLTE